MANALSLILSVVWSQDGNVTGALDEPAAHLSCLWPVDQTTKSEETKRPSDAAMQKATSAFAFIIAVVVAVFNFM